jgi:hypothetical protein
MVYKIRVILDSKDSIFRDIEIKDKQTLWNLHLGIKSAFSLQGEELSMFSILDQEGIEVKSVPLEDMSDDGDGEIMSDVYLMEAFQEVGDKVQFQYGLIDLWEFFCELVEIIEEKPAVNYPITVFRFGNVPLKAPSKSNGGSSKSSVSSVFMDEDFGDIGGEFKDDYDDDDFVDDEEEEDGFGDDFAEDELED